MLPTVGTDTPKIIWYASEVGGRTLGVAAMVNLVPDPERRAAIEQAGKAIIAAAQQLAGQYTARLLFEFIDQRVTVGKGRGVDRGFDAGISASIRMRGVPASAIETKRCARPRTIDVLPTPDGPTRQALLAWRFASTSRI